MRSYSADDLVAILCISKQHAYRLIANPDQLTNQHRELIIFKDLRLLPGWAVEIDGLRAPNGNLITAEAMEYNSQVHQRHSALQDEVKELNREIEALRNHIGWLHGKLARPPAARSTEYDRGPIEIAKHFGQQDQPDRGWQPRVIDGKASSE